MIKVAVASQNEIVSEHYGHCKNFNIFETQDGKIIAEESVLSPGHDSGNIHGFLAENNVTVVISGGMGKGALDKLQELNIQVVLGAKGSAKEAAEAFLNETLVSKNTLCASHAHHHQDDHHEHSGSCHCEETSKRGCRK